MKNILIIILFAAIIGLGIYILSNKKVITPTEEKSTSHCGFTVNSPLPGSIVTFPLFINAVVDNINSKTLGCSWTVFEAQAGGVVVKDSTGAILATSTMNTTEDWTTSNPVTYTSTIPTLSNPSYAGPLTIVFTEDNPSGNPNPDTLSVSVTK